MKFLKNLLLTPISQPVREIMRLMEEDKKAMRRFGPHVTLRFDVQARPTQFTIIDHCIQKKYSWGTGKQVTEWLTAEEGEALYGASASYVATKQAQERALKEHEQKIIHLETDLSECSKVVIEAMKKAIGAGDQSGTDVYIYIYDSTYMVVHSVEAGECVTYTNRPNETMYLSTHDTISHVFPNSEEEEALFIRLANEYTLQKDLKDKAKEAEINKEKRQKIRDLYNV